MKDIITLAHGSGGRLSRELVEREILPRFGNKALMSLPDAANLPLPLNRLIFSTDSFVVQPLFFPGGNIGELAVYGTANDIAVSGGKPLWMSLGMIIEEGLPLEELRPVLDSIKEASAACGIQVVTGDTKVVPSGMCDKLYLNTSGIGELLTGFELDAARISAGDAVIVSGTIGDHGMAIAAAREALKIKGGPASDCAAVLPLVLALRELAGSIRIMRDPTRGGVAAVLNEFIAGTPFGISVDESSLPFSPASSALADMLGFDLLQIACEGRIVAVCEQQAAATLIDCWRSLPEGQGAAVIGEVDNTAGKAVLKTVAGGRRLIDIPEGELLPRIC